MLFIKSLGRLAPLRLTATTVAAQRNLFITNHPLSPTSSPPSSAASLSSPPQSSSPEQYNDQEHQLIDIKDSCLKRLKQVLEKPGEEYLRIQVETGGCSGFSYLFDIESNAKLDPKEDLIFERDNHRIVVNKDILPYMKGASIEYTESLIKSSFQITNPVAETKCSCGSSFSIDLAKLSKSSQQQRQQTGHHKQQ